jgi:hypothetical protein
VFTEILKSYKITQVVGDRYAGEWPRERFRMQGIAYISSEKSLSQGAYDDLANSVAGALVLAANK